jgi:hypothetical protein
VAIAWMMWSNVLDPVSCKYDVWQEGNTAYLFWNDKIPRNLSTCTKQEERFTNLWLLNRHVVWVFNFLRIPSAWGKYPDPITARGFDWPAFRQAK